MENNPEVVVIESNEGEEVLATAATGTEEANVVNNDESTPYAKRKRKKTSGVWDHFRLVTKIISGSEYPTSNLFLSELYGIKEALDELILDESKYMRDMAAKMKKKFDKYWGTCNLLISIGVVLDPRYKMKLLEFSFNAIYSTDEAPKQMKIVHDTLTKMFEEYV
ncbi:hypothetical protein L6452_32146 [Arctium lappa]|uniref:Uncharacterized protein n=1 Tax=Arctium lappa TaxID=4217 RepID=A0ACB8Z2W3_ARCLA|nr:hypothetical protein L6452_32146 [Arctium lappa]